jgi:hypothetical protein
LEVLLFRTTSKIVRIEKAKKESIGIEINPNSSKYFSVQETPREQG